MFLRNVNNDVKALWCYDKYGYAKVYKSLIEILLNL
jgi:hypothetical protein|nr:hypothetical protein [Mucilaginibacter sp. E4BP6]